MDTNLTRPIDGVQSPAEPEGEQRTTSLLLLGGAAAGPLFTTVVLTQALTREHFDLRHQPLSLLSLGDLGWLQITNFVVTGLLLLGLAVGLRRCLGSGPGRVWAPALMGLHGVGLVLAGVLVPDPALGYPPGTPDAVPSDFTWHGLAHAFTPPLAFGALVVCCLVMARRFVASRDRGRALYAAGTAAVALLLCAWPVEQGASVRLAVAAVVGFAWTTFTALDLRRRRGSGR
jgi:hypothetical membrane protein